MRFEKCDWRDSYGEMYLALIEAHKEGKALRVYLDGKHHGSVLAALRRRHDDKATRVGSARGDDGTLIVSIEKEFRQ